MAKASPADNFDDFFDSPSRSPDPINLYELDTEVKQSVSGSSKSKTCIAKPSIGIEMIDTSSSTSSSRSEVSLKKHDGGDGGMDNHVHDDDGHHREHSDSHSAVSDSFASSDIDSRNQKQRKTRTISENSFDSDNHSDSDKSDKSDSSSKHRPSVSGRNRSSPNKSDLNISASGLTEIQKFGKKLNSRDLERNGSWSRSSRQSSNDSGKTSDLLIHEKAKKSPLKRDTRRYSNSSGHSSDSRVTPDSHWRNRKDRSSSSESNRASPQARDKTKRRKSSSESSQSNDSRRASPDVVKKKPRKDSINSSVASSSSSKSVQMRNKALVGDRSPNRISHSHTSYSSGSSTPDSARNRRKDSYSSAASSSSSTHTYSQKDDMPYTPIDKQEHYRSQAWNAQSKFNKKCLRPNTAKQHTSPRKNAYRKQEKKEHSSVDSDSDMTDVSPITSPRNGFSVKHGKDAGDGSNSNQKKFQAMPLHTDDKYMFDGGDKKSLDLNILMKAVTELEKQKRVESNTRRVMFEPVRARTRNKSNFTFSIDDTRRIDQENQRLLHQIVRQMHTTEEKTPKMSDVKIKQAVITTSAINRRRQQQKIESENLAFLKRLQKVQASKGLSRTEQLSAYNSTVIHGVPIAALHPAKASACKSSGSSCAGSLSRTRSLTSLHSAATSSSFKTSSQQSSRAGSRPSSAKRSVRDRPPWDDRW